MLVSAKYNYWIDSILKSKCSDVASYCIRIHSFDFSLEYLPFSSWVRKQYWNMEICSKNNTLMGKLTYLLVI